MLPTEKLRVKKEKKRVARKPHRKLDRIERDKARVEVKRFLKQQHEYKTTRKKHLANKPNLKVSGPYRNTLPPCKQCTLRKREQGSSRCSECSLYFNRNKREFIPLPKPV